MPRYLFHIVEGTEVFDSLRSFLPNDKAARARAIELAANFEELKLAQAFRVTDEQDAIPFRVPIRRSS